MIQLSRRRLLLSLGAGTLMLPLGRGAHARISGQKKLVVVILRGALDGLSALPPTGDPDYPRLRRSTRIPGPGEPGAALALAEGFGLHPRLAFLHERWQAAELAVLPATSSPYRQRSHFDGQNILEGGGQRAFECTDGWLNRALALADRSGAALSPAAPLLLAGAAPVTTWTPSAIAQPDEDTVQRLVRLYAEDSLLGPALQQAIQTAALLGDDAGPSSAGGGRRDAAAVRALMAAAATLLSAPQGPSAAVVSLTGWDSHSRQGGSEGALATRLAGLDRALRGLRQDLGEAWARTAVLVATEFGRTAAENGTGGTDHGTGAAAFLVGGAVRGGRIRGDWPGLSPAELFEGRDLRPTTDLRSFFAGVLTEHWGISPDALRSRVFPDATGLPIMADLIA